MPGKIFYRERRKVEGGEKKPRFRVVAVSGVEVEFFAQHLRQCELKAVAEAVGAELVALEGGSGEGKGHGADSRP